MNVEEASRVLDLVKAGYPIPDDLVTEALFLTGDGAVWQDIPAPDIEAFLADLRQAGLL